MLSVQPNQPPLVGDRFQLIGTIDHSGTTWQYLAWDSAESRWCVVRMLGFNYVRDPLARARFERQVRQLERVKHPNVLPVYSADAAHPTHPWVATAVAEGGSLADWMALHGTLPPYLAIDVMAHVCNGLAAAHAAGVSHGNLKVEHVLIDRHGLCMVTGLRGGSERGDQQADLKAAGALLYTLLTGKQLDDRNAAGQLQALPLPIARSIEQTRRLRGGFANVAQLSRDLEAGVLELPAPSGNVPPLAGPDAALGSDPWAVWNPDTVFSDIEHLANLSSNPNYAPAEDYVPEPTRPRTAPAFTSFDTSEAPLPNKPPEPPRTAGKSRGYQMSRPVANTQPGPPKPGFTDPGKPLYEEPPERPKWENWSPDVSVTVGPKKKKEDEPAISDFVLLRVIALVAALLFSLTVSFTIWSVSTVNQARAEAEQAGILLAEVVRGESGLVYDLGRSGGDQQKLEAAYFEFIEAKNEITRTQAALAFAKLTQQEAERAGLNKPDARVSELAERVGRITTAYGEAMGKRQEWADSSSHLPGSFAVALGLQYGPSDY